MAALCVGLVGALIAFGLLALPGGRAEARHIFALAACLTGHYAVRTPSSGVDDLLTLVRAPV